MITRESFKRNIIYRCDMDKIERLANSIYSYGTGSAELAQIWQRELGATLHMIRVSGEIRGSLAMETRTVSVWTPFVMGVDPKSIRWLVAQFESVDGFSGRGIAQCVEIGDWQLEVVERPAPYESDIEWIKKELQEYNELAQYLLYKHPDWYRKNFVRVING
jgi:hypothetical protein